MDKLKKALYKLIDGRYGGDELSKFIIYILLLLWIINYFVKSTIIYIIGSLMCLFVLIRFFSKNNMKRTAENARYLQIRKKIISNIESFINKILENRKD